MEAGKKLDALVAEKVMGWRLSSDGLLWFEEGHVLPVELVDEWDPSGDFSAAWEVVEKMLSLGFHVNIRDIHDQGLWHVLFSKIPGATRHEPENWCETSPLAICLAALKAVGERP